MAGQTPWASHLGAGGRTPRGAGGVRALGRPASETEGRSGLTIDDRHGGRYVGIPQPSLSEPLPINPVSTTSGAVHNDLAARRVLASPWYLTAEVISTLRISRARHDPRLEHDAFRASAGCACSAVRDRGRRGHWCRLVSIAGDAQGYHEASLRR